MHIGIKDLTRSCKLTPQTVTFCAKNAQKLPARYAVELGVRAHVVLSISFIKGMKCKTS